MFEFEITFDDGHVESVTADMRDVARWEMNGNDRVISDLSERLPVSTLYELAYYALKRQKKFDGTLDDLLDLANLDIVKTSGDNPKATPKARTRTR